MKSERRPDATPASALWCVGISPETSRHQQPAFAESLRAARAVRCKRVCFPRHAALVGFYALLLTGCASGVTIPTEVRVAVPTPCIAPADRPERPPLRSDAELLALDSYRATWALWGERLELLAYSQRMEAVVEGCSRLTP